MTTDVIPAVGAYRASTSMEPYRATRLWNDMIQTVYSGLALGRHRRYMKAYDQCFVASEAITWLHKQLQQNPNFGLAVTRNQTMQLFQKFHAAKIFEDVRGTKHNNEMFADNGRLFRYVDSSESPVNIPRSSIRNPLATRNTMMNTDSGHSGPVKCMPEKTVVRPLTASDGRLVSKSQPTPKEVEYVWKMITLKWLQRLLRRSSLDDILDTCHVHAPNIIHNMTQVNKNGIVTNIDQKDQLPHWVLSAMRCLAYWPEKVDDHLPDYPGFQKDVFKVVKDYFDSQAEPLLTFNMYEAFANVVVYAEGIGQPRLPARSTVPSNGGLSHELMTSVENLIMNMTVDKRESTTAEVRPQDIIIVHDPSVVTSGGQMFSYESVASMPGAKFETSFGVDSVEPHTHVYPLPGQWDSASLDAYSQISHDQRDARSCSSSRLEPYSGDQKSVSLMDVNNVTPIPENTLSNYVFRDSLTSVTSSINAETHGGKNESYGYSVVLSSVPDIRCHAAKDTTPPSEQGRKLQPDLANPVYQYQRSDLPPPYKPPPSYTSLHQSGVFLVSGERLLAPPKSCQRSQFTGGIARPTSAMKRSPTASFRQAIEGGQTETPPKTRHALLATLKRSTSSPSLLNSTASRNCVIESLQTCCLLLPPANRRKLHLLLRLMHKMVNNSRLQVEDGVSTRKLVLEQFSRCILRPREEVDFDEGLTAHIVELMMDNYMDIMKVPDDLKDKIEDKLTWLRKSKVHSDDRPASEDTGGFDSDSCQKKMTFCERVTVSEYEHQKLSSSQGALQELLDGIVKNKEMTLKEKKKHLKHFRKSYPDIYCQRFPTTQSESSLFPDKPRIKPALLGRPLQKLRSLRL